MSPSPILGQKNVRVMDKGASATPAPLVTPGTETARTASLTTLVKEILPQRKRQWTSDKGKDKANSNSFSVWDDAGVMMAKAQETFTTEEMKAFSGSSPSELVNHHLHKLVQVMHLCKFILSSLPLFFFFLKSDSFSLGARGEPPPYFGVSYSGGQSQVCSVPGGGLGGGELEVEERFDNCYERS